MKIAISVIASIVVAAAMSSAIAQTNTPEIADPYLNDVAAVFPDQRSPSGAIIKYNPNTCALIGAACKFIRVHEHCHVELGHHLSQGRVSRRRMESAADRCASSFASANAVYAAWTLFANGGSSSDWHTYGTPGQRAIRLCEYAKSFGNWYANHDCNGQPYRN